MISQIINNVNAWPILYVELDIIMHQRNMLPARHDALFIALCHAGSISIFSRYPLLNQFHILILEIQPLAMGFSLFKSCGKIQCYRHNSNHQHFPQYRMR